MSQKCLETLKNSTKTTCLDLGRRMDDGVWGRVAFRVFLFFTFRVIVSTFYLLCGLPGLSSLLRRTLWARHATIPPCVTSSERLHRRLWFEQQRRLTQGRNWSAVFCSRLLRPALCRIASASAALAANTTRRPRDCGRVRVPHPEGSELLAG